MRSGGVVYEFELEPTAQRLTVPAGGSWVLFSATFSGGGSGTLTRFAILRMTGARIVNLLPEVALTNSNEQTVWTEPRLSQFPILLTADFDWDFAAGETHFSPHRYWVTVWRFDPTRAVYVKAIRYRTSRKYDSLDAADRIDVIGPERAEILRRLALFPIPHS